MFKKILVVVDGSKTMEETVRFACDLAKMAGGTMTLIHAVALPTPVGSSVPFDSAPLEQFAKKVLEAALKMAEGSGCRADTILETDYGNSGHIIARIAQEKGFSLIVIHARGHSKVESLLLGSVSDTVAHRAPCPVLIVRP